MAEKKYVRAEFSQKNLTSKLIQKLLPTHFSFDRASDEDWIHFGEGQSFNFASEASYINFLREFWRWVGKRCVGAWKRATFVSGRVGARGCGCKLGYICGMLEVGELRVQGGGVQAWL